MMTIKTKCKNRKEMVQKLSEHLNTKAEDLRAPTYAFQIGRITVNQDASISGEAEDLLLVADFLAANGYLDGIPKELRPQTESEPETGSEPETESEQTDAKQTLPEFVRASIPLQGSTVKEVQNILRTLYARQDMINLMTQNSSIRIDEEVLDLINEATTTQQIE